MTAEDHVTEPDPTQLPLHELRALRADLQAHDDVVSYVRRVAQARLDLVEAEIRHRTEATAPAAPADAHDDVPAELRNVLGHHLTGGPARPPRPADDASEHPLALELEATVQPPRHGRPRRVRRRRGWAPSTMPCATSSSAARTTARTCSTASTRSAPSWSAATARARPTSTGLLADG